MDYPVSFSSGGEPNICSLDGYHEVPPPAESPKISPLRERRTTDDTFVSRRVFATQSATIQQAGFFAPLVAFVLLLLKCGGDDSEDGNLSDAGTEKKEMKEKTDPCRETPDSDGDGYNSRSCGGDDCNDYDSDINPEAREIIGNGRDENCNGMADGELSCTDVHATVGCADSTFTSIQAAIDSVSPGCDGTISICTGTYDEVLLTSNRNIRFGTVDGDVILTGDGVNRALTITSGSEVYVDGDGWKRGWFKFEGGRSSGNGGAVLIDGAHVTFALTKFTDNAARNGGAVALEGGSAWFGGTVFQDNHADENGGGFYCDRGFTRAHRVVATSIDGYEEQRPIWRSNDAGEKGGAIFIQRGIAENSYLADFLSNSSPRGSAIFFGTYGFIEIDDGTINYNNPGAALELGNPGSAVNISGDSEMLGYTTDIFIGGVDEAYDFSEFGGSVSCSYDTGLCE